MRHTIFTSITRKAVLLRKTSLFLNVAIVILYLSACSGRSDQPSSPPGSEAQKAAEQFWFSALTECGGSHYARDNRSLPGAGLAIYQFNDVSVEVKPARLTEADRLNGVEWDGRTILRSKTSREHVSGWGPWRNGTGFSDSVALMKKVRGRWAFGARGDANPPLKKVDCSEVPR